MTKLFSISYLVIILVSLLSTVSAHAFKLPDTGQTKCYQLDPLSEISCGGTGWDGEYNINPMSFTDNLDGTVTDSNTGLMWQQENGDLSTWYLAPSFCSSLTTGGYTDWRMPSKKELMTIVNYGIPFPGPTIDTTYFPNTVDWFYWSSTTGWAVNFQQGWVRDDWLPLDYDERIRCVRGRLTFGNFQDNGNDTVTDKSTGLMWQQRESGATTWQNALNYCNGLSLGSESDWRLPNIKELASITFNSGTPALDMTFFPDVNITYYWSSTVYAGAPSYAWCVDFYTGIVIDRSESYNNIYVRCVRGGWSGGAIDTLSISRVGYGSGTVMSWPAGINCGGTCWATFPTNSIVGLSSTPDVGGSIFSGWSGAADCVDAAVTMTTTTSCTAIFDFCQGNPARVGATGYNSIGDAYGDENTGAAMSGDTIEIIASNQQETLDFAKGKEVALRGGNNCQFAPLPYSFTTITGSLTISTGSVTVDRVAIQ